MGNRYYIQSGGAILGEIESSSPFTATCAEIAEDAPADAILVELETGLVCAWRSTLLGGIVGWSFHASLVFDDEADTARRSVA